MWLIKSYIAWLQGGSGGAVGEGQEERVGGGVWVVGAGSQSRKFKWRSGQGNQSPSRRGPTKHVPLNEVRARRQAPTSHPLTSVCLGKGHEEARLPRRLACFALRGSVFLFFSYRQEGRWWKKIHFSVCVCFWRSVPHFVYTTGGKDQGFYFFFQFF